MVPGKGIEPLTRSLQGCRSATELDRRIWWNPMESNHLLMLFRHPREPSTPEFRNLAGQEGFEPSTIRLTAERTTAVLLTLK